jgi:hypothetical protein
MVRPRPASESYSLPSRAPAPTVTTSPSTTTDRMGETSIRTPPVEEWPAKQCPPLRIAVGSPARLASEIVAVTSPGVAHRTTASGRTSWNRAIGGLRASS